MSREDLIRAFAPKTEAEAKPKPAVDAKTIADMQDRIEMLEDALGTSKSITDGYNALGRMKPISRRVLGLLMKREECTRQLIWDSLYGDRVNGGPSIKLVDVHMSHLRSVLRKHGVEITTLWGEGYCMSPAQKNKVRDILRNFLEEATRKQ